MVVFWTKLCCLQLSKTCAPLREEAAGQAPLAKPVSWLVETRPPPKPAIQLEHQPRWKAEACPRSQQAPEKDTMHLGKVGLLAFGAVAVEAFRDTSPFFFASTSEYVLFTPSQPCWPSG